MSPYDMSPHAIQILEEAAKAKIREGQQILELIRVYREHDWNTRGKARQEAEWKELLVGVGGKSG